MWYVYIKLLKFVKSIFFSIHCMLLLFLFNFIMAWLFKGDPAELSWLVSLYLIIVFGYGIYMRSVYSKNDVSKKVFNFYRTNIFWTVYILSILPIIMMFIFNTYVPDFYFDFKSIIQGVLL